MKRMLSVTLLLALLPAAALAQQFSKDDNAARMRLGNDLYAAGNFLTITENVDDDLFIAGNQITVQGAVVGDLHAVGSNLTINGNVTGDVRIAGGNVTVNGTIGGDLLMAGGSIYLSPSAVIEGSLLAGGGAVRVEGTVRGNVKVAGDDITYLGTTAGAADIRGEKIAMGGSVGGNAILAGRTLTIDPALTIGGNLNYWSKAGAMTVGAQVAGKTTLDETLKLSERTPGDKTKTAGAAAGLLGAISIFALLSAALSIGVFQLATKKCFIDAAAKLRGAPGMSILWGLIYFLLTPIVILLLMVTIIGIPLALALGAMYFVSMLFAQVLTAMVLARVSERKWAKKQEKWHPAALYFAALGIWIVMKLLWLIPVLGWIIVVLAVFAGYGALLNVKWERFKQVA